MKAVPADGSRGLWRLGVLALIAVSGACGDDEPRAWELVWEDEFEGPAGQLPDSRRWGFDVGTDWGNQQLEYDTDRPENASLDGDGNLVIVAREEVYEGQPYTSARITTKDRFERTLGRFEARIRLPLGQGLWPAFWLLGADIDEVGWPQTGEIDVMEYRGQEPTVVHASLHGPGYSGGNAVTTRYTLPNGRFDTSFHVFAVEWEASVINWYVDGVLIKSVARSEVPGPWVYDHPFYIILNLAVGGTFAEGPPDETVTFPRTMTVDWVRVYERAR